PPDPERLVVPGQLLVPSDLASDRSRGGVHLKSTPFKLIPRLILFVLIGVSTGIGPAAALPAWPDDPVVISQNRPVDPVNWSWPLGPIWVGKGSNGAYLTWIEVGHGNQFEIHGQRLSPLGKKLWGEAGTNLVPS